MLQNAGTAPFFSSGQCGRKHPFARALMVVVFVLGAPAVHGATSPSLEVSPLTAHQKKLYLQSERGGIYTWEAPADFLGAPLAQPKVLAFYTPPLEKENEAPLKALAFYSPPLQEGEKRQPDFSLQARAWTAREQGRSHLFFSIVDPAGTEKISKTRSSFPVLTETCSLTWVERLKKDPLLVILCRFGQCKEHSFTYPPTNIGDKPCVILNSHLGGVDQNQQEVGIACIGPTGLAYSHHSCKAYQMACKKGSLQLNELPGVIYTDEERIITAISPLTNEAGSWVVLASCADSESPQLHFFRKNGDEGAYTPVPGALKFPAVSEIDTLLPLTSGHLVAGNGDDLYCLQFEGTPLEGSFLPILKNGVLQNPGMAIPYNESMPPARKPVAPDRKRKKQEPVPPGWSRSPVMLFSICVLVVVAAAGGYLLYKRRQGAAKKKATRPASDRQA